MRFSVISDIHLSIGGNLWVLNDADVVIKHLKESAKRGGYDYLLLAGDVSSDSTSRHYFLEQTSLCCGIYVEGNHILYNGEPLQDNLTDCRTTCPKGWTFLENNYVALRDEEYNEYIVVGAILWTDLEYGGSFEDNCCNAQGNLNDYRVGRVLTQEGIERFTPEYSAKLHRESKEYIASICEKFPDATIVVLTHHAPSKKSISRDYVKSNINASYISDLDRFIKKHKNIKLWVHGHIHTPFDYMVGDCRVVCNPMGYRGEGSLSEKIVDIPKK